MKNKIISAGILLEVGNKFLLAHASGQGMTKGFGIPKGKVDEGESLLECALREFREETNLDISKYNIEVAPVPFINFNVGSNKTVHVFHASSPDLSLLNYEFSCPSLVPNTDIPEIDAYAWLDKKHATALVTSSQKIIFEKL